VCAGCTNVCRGVRADRHRMAGIALFPVLGYALRRNGCVRSTVAELPRNAHGKNV
jgi:hypothetical protein